MNEIELTRKLWDNIDNIGYFHAEMLESHTGVKLNIDNEYYLISVNKL